jgi:flagellum-specific ATP synthase
VSLLAPQIAAMESVQPMRLTGRVSALRGLTVLVEDLPMPVGSLVSIRGEPGAGRRAPVLGEIVGFTREHAIVMLLGQTGGIRAGDPVVGEQAAQTVPVGDRMLGRIIDGLARPIDGLGPIHETVARPLHAPPLGPMQRRRIVQAMHTGVRAIDLMATLGRGQRIGIFSGPGVGKSTLLGQIARHASADVNVIALIGERGREVGDFIEHSLGPAGLAKSVVVVATGDESPLLRIRAALLACSVAEHFRDQGRDVMLTMDSVTRFAHAQRQVGLSVGEPPATKGYTPSVFSSLAILLERAGAVQNSRGAEQQSSRLGPDQEEKARGGGSITGLYTVLVEGDDMTEPVADAARGILDGHLILSRKLVQRAHYPAIDILDSVSRVADDVSDPLHVNARRQIARLMAQYRDVEDLVQIGAYARGSNPQADVAIDFQPRIRELLQQGKDERQAFEQARGVMVKLALESGDALQRRTRELAGAAGGTGR